MFSPSSVVRIKRYRADRFATSLFVADAVQLTALKSRAIVEKAALEKLQDGRLSWIFVYRKLLLEFIFYRKDSKFRLIRKELKL